MTRILGIDPGAKRCGIAITDSAQRMAFPRPALAMGETITSRLTELIESEGVGRVVIGRPVALSGRETASTEAADAFFELVQRSVAVPVVQFDERLTTRDAQKSLSGAGLTAKASRERVDSAAAVIMLQNYVDGLNAE